MKHLIIVLVAVLCAPSLTSAWWPRGHATITDAAVQATPEVPGFFKAGAAHIAHMTADPDVARNWGTPLASAAEHGEHYIDIEMLEGRELPARRYEFIDLCYELGIKPPHVGLVPYAVSEWTERLALAFAEHRKWPDNPVIKSKCLTIAGNVAHYAQDMTQPLHLTIHFNGRPDPDKTLDEGDTIYGSFQAIDGKGEVVPGAEPEDRRVQIGDRRANADLSKALLGIKLGESRDVSYSETLEDGGNRTVHFRVTANRIQEQRGLHEKIDGLPLTLEMTADQLAEGIVVAPADSLMEEVIAHVKRGFALVDRAYELGPNMPRHGQEGWERDEEVVTFAIERAKEAARFTASMFLTAWKRSETIELPGWLDRGPEPAEHE